MYVIHRRRDGRAYLHELCPVLDNHRNPHWNRYGCARTLGQLSWSASTSSSVSGYNIYRAPYASACGSFSKINSLLNTGTLYTDSAVVDGATYCYATTAVNTSNEESGYSNVVSNVQVPAP
jgi:hypothetical protein